MDQAGEGRWLMDEIHVYGELRRYVNKGQNDRRSVIRLAPRGEETLESLLMVLGIPTDEINHVFLNSKLLATRTSMASYMGFEQSRRNVHDWNLDIPVDSGDRIGLFGKDMAILGM
jgi:hypothetical protein